MNYEKWVEVLTNYYEEDLNNCTMSNEVWINQIATAITTPDLFKNDVIEYRKVEGREATEVDLHEEARERTKEREYYLKRGNTSGTID